MNGSEPPMHPRATELIRTLELEPHREGGFFRQVFRSPRHVTPDDGRAPRPSLTVIHFLLPAGQHSRWHVVRSDELWAFEEGEPLELLVASPDAASLQTTRLGPLRAGAEPARIVPADHWQAARSTGPFTLVLCAVAPGFEYADFRFVADDAAAHQRLERLFPEYASLL